MIFTAHFLSAWKDHYKMEGKMENQEPKHKRRVRYKGTHPRSYKEKYKELQPEKYGEDVYKRQRYCSGCGN